MTPWTRLENTELWKAARRQYQANGNIYHSFAHPMDLYWHADTLGLPYDPVLDRAILAHDVILDGNPEPEARSADWLEAQTGQKLPKERALIMTTADHRPNSLDSRLALLDFMDLTIPALRTRMTHKLMDEARLRSGQGDAFDKIGWLHRQMEYLNRTQQRIMSDLRSMSEADVMRVGHIDKWMKIAHGMRCTMAVAPLIFAPHPAQGIQRYTRMTEMALMLMGQQDEHYLKSAIEDVIASQPVAPNDIRKTAESLIAGMLEKGLIYKTHRDPIVSAYALTNDAKEWVAKMNAPPIDWPEPDDGNYPET